MESEGEERKEAKRGENKKMMKKKDENRNKRKGNVEEN